MCHAESVLLVWWEWNVGLRSEQTAELNAYGEMELAAASSLKPMTSR